MSNTIACRMCSTTTGTFTNVRDRNGRTGQLCDHCLAYLRDRGMIAPGATGQRSIGANDGPLQLSVPLVSWERGAPYEPNGKPKPAA